jgi:pre-mRNA-splicing factor ISY1
LLATLGDYEIRDLNDEINQLMREKRHYETQIVNLGGANYKRGNQMMTDDAGREVPGTRGYKWVKGSSHIGPRDGGDRV